MQNASGAVIPEAPAGKSWRRSEKNMETKHRRAESQGLFMGKHGLSRVPSGAILEKLRTYPMMILVPQLLELQAYYI